MRWNKILIKYPVIMCAVVGGGRKYKFGCSRFTHKLTETERERIV